ncbi:hypothetical protein ANO11243_064230 [Dothideomycetidae sp. 11243]|nr:hypothetical protein ANO11243_064230 [fungal sp. No.11243]
MSLAVPCGTHSEQAAASMIQRWSSDVCTSFRSALTTKLTMAGFRPPSQSSMIPNDLEIYNVRTDAWGLLTIAAMLLVVSGAVPLPFSNSKSRANAAAGLQPYAKAAILADVFHHVMTGLGAWEHYAKETHYNTSMGVGVWGCSGLALLGLLTLVAPSSVSGLGGSKERAKVA